MDVCALGSLSDCAERTHVVGLGVPLFPLHQDKLSYDERDDEDEHHLGVHGFVPFVFGVHSRMFQSVEQTQKEPFRTQLCLYYVSESQNSPI